MTSEVRRFYSELKNCELDDLEFVIGKYLDRGKLKKVYIPGSKFEDNKERIIFFNLKNAGPFECIVFMPDKFEFEAGIYGFKKMRPIFEKAGLL